MVESKPESGLEECLLNSWEGLSFTMIKISCVFRKLETPTNSPSKIIQRINWLERIYLRRKSDDQPYINVQQLGMFLNKIVGQIVEL